MVCSRRKVAIHLGTLGITLAGSTPTSSAPPATEPAFKPMSGEVLARAEGVLDQLRTSAASETGPVVPRPSEEVAYHLLSGLAGRGREVFLPERESQGAVHRVLELNPEARVVLEERPVQDKSGTYVSLTARLIRKRGGNWTERARGRSTRG